MHFSKTEDSAVHAEDKYSSSRGREALGRGDPSGLRPAKSAELAMTGLANTPVEDLSPEQWIKLKQLLGCEDISLLKKAGGGNSKVFCIEAQGKKWAVKSYPPYAPNQRDRLAAECMAYQFLNQHQIAAVPGFKTSCLTERWLVMDWIEGNLPEGAYSNIDIEQAIAFIRQVAQLNTTAAAQALPLAAEACLSLDVLIDQISKRFERLSAASEDEALQEFLKTFSSVFAKSEQQAREGYRQNNMQPNDELPASHRSLIPADFGFHNALRDPSGTLYFFDFDYFGWDDPVKLLADILWHPKMTLSPSQKKQFIEGLAAIYGTDPLFLTRFRYTLPLFGLRWVLILLNEFIPAFWQNRQHAEVHQNKAEAQKKQLDRAKALLNTAQQNWIAL